MTTSRLFALSIAGIAAFASHVSANDLSRYRQFQVGMSLAAVAAQAGISPEARVIQQRPAVLQELMWQPPRLLRSSQNADPVRKVVFSFYNGQLFRMVVTYDRDRTEGLTSADVIEAISATYGLPTLASRPLSSVSNSTAGSQEPSSRSVANEDTILARWDGPENSIHLFEFSYASGFGLVLVSKSLDALAQVSTAEATRLDAEEAPQREVERQQKQIDDKRLKNEAARRANRAGFRP